METDKEKKRENTDYQYGTKQYVTKNPADSRGIQRNTSDNCTREFDNLEERD